MTEPGIGGERGYGADKLGDAGGATQGASDEAWWRRRGDAFANRDRSRYVEGFRIPTERRIAGAKNRKVDFVVAGTVKGGTTALDAYLRLNPQICMPHRIKELNFFNANGMFDSGDPDYRLYHSFFKPKKVHRVLGEVTSDYMFREEVARRLHAYNPEMKIILSLRNPIDRAFSHWNMHRASGWDTPSFAEAIRRDEELSRAVWTEGVWRAPAFVDRGFYLEQIRRLRRYFPADQILIFRQEELLRNHRETLDLVWRFLEVEPLDAIKPTQKTLGHYRESLSEVDRDYLREQYRYEIRGLERLLDWDCSDWLM